jgi:hypothetical protein
MRRRLSGQKRVDQNIVPPPLGKTLGRRNNFCIASEKKARCSIDRNSSPQISTIVVLSVDSAVAVAVADEDNSLSSRTPHHNFQTCCYWEESFCRRPYYYYYYYCYYSLFDRQTKLIRSSPP